MKKLSLILLISCAFVGIVSAADSQGQDTESDEESNQDKLALLKGGALRTGAAVTGYVAAGVTKNTTGIYGLGALFALSAFPFLFDVEKYKSYHDKTTETQRTALNSFAAGVAVRAAIEAMPDSIRSNFSRGER